MSKSNQFSNFQDLGKHLGQEPPAQSQPSSAQMAFEREEKSIKANLLKSRSDHNRHFECIQLTKLGTLYRRNERFEQAIKAFKQTLEINKEDAYAFDGLGMTYFQMEDYDQAIYWFRQQLNPIVAMNNLCRAYRRKGDFDSAIEYALHTISKDSENAVAMNELGILYRLKQDYVKSVEWFEKKLQFYPKDKQALDGLGITYREQKNYPKAIECFEKKLQFYPKDKQALDGLGITYREQKNYPKAIECFEKQLQFYPKDKQALDGLGITYREQKNYPKAIECFEKKLQFDPKNKQALDGLGITYREQKNYPKAIECFEKKLQFYPKDKQALDGLGITYREQQNYPKAIECFEKKLQFYPKDKQALDGLGITYREQKNYPKAIECFEKKLQFDPKNKQALDGLGITYREQKNYPKAIECFEKKLQFYPNDSYAQQGLNKTYHQMGTTVEAIPCWKQLLLERPNNNQARENLTQIAEQFKQQEQFKQAEEIINFLQTVAKPNKSTRPVLKTSTPELSKEDEKEDEIETRISSINQELQQKKAALIHTKQVANLGMMTSGLAHELMQPLQIILATAQNCRMDMEIGKQEHILNDLQKIEKTVKRIDHIVSHLHVLSRERKPHIELINIEDIINNAFSFFHEQFKMRGIQIEYNIANDLPMIETDKVQLEQVIINLISNARDALENSLEKIIKIQVFNQQDELNILFTDTGCGMNPEWQQRIFEPFETNKAKGTGLGLYIVQDTIQQYAGQISVTSEAEKGTTFTIRLPLKGQNHAEKDFID